VLSLRAALYHVLDLPLVVFTFVVDCIKLEQHRIVGTKVDTRKESHNHIIATH
jgi:hypothetical protein